MRAALWLVGLFGAAVAVALFVGNHQGTVTVFWPPWRVDLSLNLVVVGLLGGFVLLHAALRATSALLALPRQARFRNMQRAPHRQGHFRKMWQPLHTAASGWCPRRSV